MRVLITGMAGFIGSHLYDRLTAEGHEVWGVDNFETGRHDNAPAFFVDVADAQSLFELASARKPELVIHCAASYKNPDDWVTDTRTNVRGTINAVSIAELFDAKLVYFQTGLPPVSSYAISKLAGEQYIHLSGVPHLIFRLANVYGPRNVSGPIPTFYKRISEGLPCTAAATTRDMVYVDDLVDCVTLALGNDLTGTFDVCSGVQTPILAQWNAVNDALGEDAARPLVVPPSKDDVIPDVSPDNGVPGWKPETPLEQGVGGAVAWYEQHGVAQTYTHLTLKEKVA